LSVHPFASLPSFVQDGVPRLLINKERVGGLGSRSDDVLELGDCDAGVRKLAAACGWLEELEGLWAETVPKEAMQLGRAEERTKDEQLQDEVDQITKDVEQTLKLASDNRSGAKSEIEKMLDKQMAKQTARQEMVIRGPRIEVKGESSSLAHVFPHLQDNLGS
jgi:NAD+-dependent protein deacetylase SIR2